MQLELLNKINIINIENSIYLNSLFPHKLSRLITKYKFRLILLSTDCVFSVTMEDIMKIIKLTQWTYMGEQKY